MKVKHLETAVRQLRRKLMKFQHSAARHAPGTSHHTYAIRQVARLEAAIAERLALIATRSRR